MRTSRLLAIKLLASKLDSVGNRGRKHPRRSAACGTGVPEPLLDPGGEQHLPEPGLLQGQRGARRQTLAGGVVLRAPRQRYGPRQRCPASPRGRAR